MQHRRRAAKTPAGNTDLVALARRIRQAQMRGEFPSYCASIGVHSRKAYDLIAIANAVDAGLLENRLVQEIGWSKARLIAEYANTKSEARRAIAFARRNTLPALAAYFKKGASEALVTKSFHLTRSQAEDLEAALLSAGAQRRGGRLVNRPDALMRVLRDYRSFAARNHGG